MPKSTGFSFIEVLLALLLLSIGLLMVTFVAVNSLKQAQRAFQTSLALVQVSNSFERLQAVSTLAARWQQCQAWQRQNQVLLNHAQGECQVHDDLWRVTLQWGGQPSQMLSYEQRL